ncbi:MAG: hypothetical protein GC168_11390 [Candidatus Hydrogenedens sp.]|nr:hypothetical protein [Candidatus Hydrogenedens sp.]
MDVIVDYITGLSPEELTEAFLEDVALCAAWEASYRDEPAKLAMYPGLSDTIDRWVATVNPAPLQTRTEGLRQQPLLRRYTNDLIRGRIDELARDELDFLYYAWMLQERAEKDDLFERSMECMRPFIRQLEIRREMCEVRPGLPNLMARVALFTPADMKAADPRDVRVFAGIEAPVRGPVLVHNGDAKIIGGIPDDCAVVIEDGSAYVRGGVHGKLAATKSCDITGQISGLVIARQGQVRAGALLNLATVISKEGSVKVVSCEGPRLVFAGNEISIRDTCKGGVYKGAKIHVGDTVSGGEIHCAEEGRALVWEHTEERKLSIVLRRSLTPRDYGEVLTIESMRLYSGAIHVRQRAHHVRGLMALTERETDEYAGNVLAFIMGRESSPARLQNAQQFQRALAYVDRIDVAIDSLVKIIEDQLDLEEVDDDEDTPRDTLDLTSVKVEVRLTIEDMESDLGQLVAEGPIDKSALDFREVVVKAGRQLTRHFVTEHQTILELQALIKLQEKLRDKRDELKHALTHRDEPAAPATSEAAILEKARNDCARVEVLHQLLRVARSGGGGEAFRKRCADRYVKIMQRNIENRGARIVSYATQLRKLQTDILTIRHKLWKEFRVSLPKQILDGPPASTARIRGRFTEGALICGWPHQVESKAARAGEIALAPDSGEQELVFERRPNGQIKPVQEKVS